jgi:hypothetical protein
VSGVVQRLQFVAVKAVLPIRRRMQRDTHDGKQHQESEVAGKPEKYAAAYARLSYGFRVFDNGVALAQGCIVRFRQPSVLDKTPANKSRITKFDPQIARPPAYT